MCDLMWSDPDGSLLVI